MHASVYVCVCVFSIDVGINGQNMQSFIIIVAFNFEVLALGGCIKKTKTCLVSSPRTLQIREHKSHCSVKKTQREGSWLGKWRKKIIPMII